MFASANTFGLLVGRRYDVGISSQCFFGERQASTEGKDFELNFREASGSFVRPRAVLYLSGAMQLCDQCVTVFVVKSFLLQLLDANASVSKALRLPFVRPAALNKATGETGKLWCREDSSCDDPGHSAGSNEGRRPSVAAAARIAQTIWPCAHSRSQALAPAPRLAEEVNREDSRQSRAATEM